MKVFISWSGGRSKELAFAIREWLPLVLQYAEPWVSEKDISAGERWAQAIAGELESASFGIICITPENLNSPWILFEAGALSKSMLDAKVIPLLFGLELSDLGGPLSQFQAQKTDQNGIMEVVKSINRVSDNKASDAIIAQLVPSLWPILAEKIAKIPEKYSNEKHTRTQHEILEELVTGVRSINSRIREFDFESRELRYMNRPSSEFHPGMIEELMHSLDSREDRGASLLLVAGMFRESLPWLAELMVESYRELRNASPEEAKKIALRLTRAAKVGLRGPMAGGISRSKNAHYLAMELPHLIDRVVMPLLEPSPVEEPQRNDGSKD